MWAATQGRIPGGHHDHQVEIVFERFELLPEGFVHCLVRFVRRGGRLCGGHPNLVGMRLSSVEMGTGVSTPI